MDEPKASNNIHHFDSAAQPVQPIAYQQVPASPQPTAAIARGHVRTPTEEELSNWNEFDNPVILTQKKAVGDDERINNYSAMAFDNDDLEVPTFLRRKAD